MYKKTCKPTRRARRVLAILLYLSTHDRARAHTHTCQNNTNLSSRRSGIDHDTRNHEREEMGPERSLFSQSSSFYTSLSRDHSKQKTTEKQIHQAALNQLRRCHELWQTRADDEKQKLQDWKKRGNSTDGLSVGLLTLEAWTTFAITENIFIETQTWRSLVHCI